MASLTELPRFAQPEGEDLRQLRERVHRHYFYIH